MIGKLCTNNSVSQPIYKSYIHQIKYSTIIIKNTEMKVVRFHTQKKHTYITVAHLYMLPQSITLLPNNRNCKQDIDFLNVF